MATLQARIEGHIGTVTETVAMNSALQEAVNNLVQVLPVDKAMQYTTEKTAQAGTGIVISGRVFDVTNNNQPSRQVSTSMGERIGNSGNTTIYKSSATFPVHWVYGGKVYGHPSSTNLFAYVLESPTVAASDNSIAGLPQGTDELSILYACQQILYKRLNALTVTAIDSLPDFDYSSALETSLVNYTTLVQGTIANTTDQLNLQKQFSVISQLIENEEDVELAQVRIAEANQYLEGLKTKVQAESQTDTSKLQSVVSQFQAKLQEFQANQNDLLSQIQYFGNLYTQKLQLLTASNDGAELNRAGS